MIIATSLFLVKPLRSFLRKIQKINKKPATSKADPPILLFQIFYSTAALYFYHISVFCAIVSSPPYGLIPFPSPEQTRQRLSQMSSKQPKLSNIKLGSLWGDYITLIIVYQVFARIWVFGNSKPAICVL